MLLVIKFVIFLLTAVAFYQLIKVKQTNTLGPWHKQGRLLVTGFVANVADTLGIGSFAVVIAFNKYWKLFDDKVLPGTLNAHSIVPAFLQALFFLQVVEIDVTTLLTMVVGASIGGYLGGRIVAGLNKQAIRLAICIGYLGMAVLILGHQFSLLPIGGELYSLSNQKLFIGFIAMCCVGILPSVGVGLYAPTQIVLFLLGMHPLAAFPIMTTAGAIQQPITSLAFTIEGQVAKKQALILAGAGLLGVLISVPFVTSVEPRLLRWLLLAIVLYNTYVMAKSFRENKS